jgi:hypothetical protein
VNTTITGNTASGPNAQAIVGASVVNNSIVWGNAGGALNGAASVSFSCIEGGWAGEGVIAAPPLFARLAAINALSATAASSLQLLAHSPCIDAGSNDLLPSDMFDLDHDGNRAEALPLDLAGNCRVLQGQLENQESTSGLRVRFFSNHQLG